MRMCEICDKIHQTGNSVSHSNRKTKRRFLANIQRKRMFKDGKFVKIKICAKCLKKQNQLAFASQNN